MNWIKKERKPPAWADTSPCGPHSPHPALAQLPCPFFWDSNAWAQRVGRIASAYQPRPHLIHHHCLVVQTGSALFNLFSEMGATEPRAARSGSMVVLPRQLFLPCRELRNKSELHGNQSCGVRRRTTYATDCRNPRDYLDPLRPPFAHPSFARVIWYI